MNWVISWKLCKTKNATIHRFVKKNEKLKLRKWSRISEYFGQVGFQFSICMLFWTLETKSTCGPQRGQPGNCPSPKFSKRCLICRYNNKLQSLPPENSATASYNNCWKYHCRPTMSALSYYDTEMNHWAAIQLSIQLTWLAVCKLWTVCKLWK